MPKPARKEKHPRASRASVEHPLFPTVDGTRWCPPDPREERQAWIGEFLEAYFQINLACAQWRARRKTRDSRPAEKRGREAIEQAIAAREKLEDRAAAYGITASPVYRGEFVADLRFTDVHSAALAGPTRTSSASAVLRFRLPPGVGTRPCKT